MSGFFAAIARQRAFQPLRFREYRLIWYGQVFSTLGTWMDEVTRGWLIYELTDSAAQLGLVRGIQAIPYVLFSPFAGSAADRGARKTQLVLAQVANMLVYAITAALVFTDTGLARHVRVI